MYGIRFNGKHSYKDMGVTLGVERNIGYPEKEKIKVKVPFSNVEYDFSEIYGDQTYTERPLTYTLNILDRHTANTTEQINAIETSISNWFMNSNGKQRLYDDAMPGYYYLAEVEGGLNFDELWNHGTLTVEFTAYPFKISELQEGNDIWDTFNFLLDYAQVTEFVINGTEEIILYNPGTPNVQPKIINSSTFEVEKDGIVYTIPSGETHSQDFTLKTGENKLTVTGNGTIEFIFHKELI